MPKMNEAAEIAKIHYRYQVGENRERQDKYAKRKLEDWVMNWIVRIRTKMS